MITAVTLMYFIFTLATFFLIGGMGFHLYEGNPIYFVFTTFIYLLTIINILVVNKISENLLFSLLLTNLKGRLRCFIKRAKLNSIKFFINTIHTQEVKDCEQKLDT